MLPHVEITINETGHVTVALDDEPYSDNLELDRSGIQRVINDVTADHGPVRVHITEYDGSEFTDVALPDAKPTDNTDPSSHNTPHEFPLPPSELAAHPMTAGITGTGLQPDEEVHLALVVASHTADTDGTVEVRLPPAVLRRTGVQLLLVGATSGHTVVCGS
ncbi:hypothetical protein FXB39_07775 [Nocardioides sp. BGMRC 2183]|nr:hypothetical protein FXB39_07775 [Nocardioides sp. BGMRC 2183]